MPNIVIFFYSGPPIIVESYRRPVGVSLGPDVFGDYLATVSMIVWKLCEYNRLLIGP